MKAKVNMKNLENLIKELPRKSALKANREIQKEFKSKFLNMISKGISTIEGNGRFPAYKDKNKYPGGKKKPRPVNLYLSGKFLRSFNVVLKKTNLIEYRFLSTYGSNLEQGHRNGQKKQPKSQIIPIGQEKLAKTLELLILKIYKNAVRIR